MAENFELRDGDPAGEDFFIAVQQMLSGIATNLRVELADATTVRIPAGAADQQVGLSIQGKYRWITAPVVRAHPGGAAGTYDLHVTALPNQSDDDGPAGGDYSFALAITAEGVAPSGGVISRIIRKLTWTGTAIASIDAGAAIPSGAAAMRDLHAEVIARAAGDALRNPPITAQLPYGGSGDPAGGDYLLADGRLIAAADYPAFDALVGSGGGHKYNGGVSPGGGMVRIPDKRGRVSVGADNMGTAQGAAGRIPNSNRQLGQSGGEERHTITSDEGPYQWYPVFIYGNTAFSRVDFAGFNASAGVGVYGGNPHNNMQPYGVDNVIVRVR